MQIEIKRSEYYSMYGPTVGDKIRSVSANLILSPTVGPNIEEYSDLLISIGIYNSPIIF